MFFIFTHHDVRISLSGKRLLVLKSIFPKYLRRNSIVMVFLSLPWTSNWSLHIMCWWPRWSKTFLNYYNALRDVVETVIVVDKGLLLSLEYEKRLFTSIPFLSVVHLPAESNKGPVQRMVHREFKESLDY